ncbi:hematopoietic prostaglandin D synthase-like [Asterias rubens]|uniref:hematopoietic prostaglandin D synthase-like n=1 Tax=Asterias rubens TaxID=7604 RepID=UPI001455BAE8|nr:hematopoietic prostaglandin D synthase-like [Asterias rubens]
MPHYKLKYFDGRGRAETIRMLFKLGKTEFEDSRCEMDEWPQIKPTITTKQLPALEIDGKQYNQSKSIINYVARTCGLFGNNELEALCIDMVIDTIDDVVPPWDVVFYSTNEEEKAKNIKHFSEVEIPVIFDRMVSLLELDHAGDFFFGNKITAADVHFLCMVEVADVYFTNSLAKYPKLQAVFDRVAADPVIAEWRKVRPVTDW